jgi:hypothetical protein
MKRYFRISENFTPNPDYNVDLSVGRVTFVRMPHADIIAGKRQGRRLEHELPTH